MSDAGTPTTPSAGGGATPAATTTAACPANCPTDFVLNAPCKILKAGGGTVQMSASELPKFPAGTYAWTTASAKITLTNADTTTVTVTAKAAVSASRDAEVITVTRTAAGCAPVVKTVNVTVAKVTFSASPNQRYGYDNFDTPNDPTDDHICLKRSDYTVLKVDIAGGAVGTDFNFVCDVPDTCAVVAPDATASFDLRLNAGAKDKASTTLSAKVKCPSALSFASIMVHVYQERLAEVVVAKIDHPTNTCLRFKDADYASHSATANDKLKEAVVRYNITNFDADNKITPVTFVSGTGVLSFDINKGGGADLDAIKAAMTGTGTKVRVAIIRDMKSYYYLSAASAIGDTTLTVTAASVFFVAGNTPPLGLGASQETVTITAVAGSTITCAPLTKAHAIGDPIEFPAGGWSTDPILIIEGNESLLVAKWTVLHEVGHRRLELADIIDTTDFMNYMQDWTDYRLRYCPRLKKYPDGTTDKENQWETIPRS